MFKLKTLGQYSIEQLVHRQKQLNAWKYLMIALGFFIAMLCISSILQFYDLIPDIEDSVVQFIMGQNVFIILVIAALLISMECYISAQLTKIVQNQIEIIKTIKEKENG